MANSVDPDQTAPIGAVCYGSTLFASILNLIVILGNYLQQTTSADDIFRCVFLFGALRVYIGGSIIENKTESKQNIISRAYSANASCEAPSRDN